MEIWKDIDKYEGLYQISNEGRVKSLGNDKTRKDKILKPYINTYGYLMVRLFNNCKISRFYVHRLVAEHFIQNPNGLPCVNHKDECKTNNRVENLEWCDITYNNTYGTRLKKVAEKLKGKKRSSEIITKITVANSKQVYQYTINGKLVAIWPSTTECGRNGYDQSCVSDCCRGERMTHKGYKWSYIPL